MRRATEGSAGRKRKKDTQCHVNDRLTYNYMLYFFIINLKKGGRAMKKYTITLTQEEREELGKIIRKGKHRSQKVINALILLNCDEGKFQNQRSTNAEASKVLKVSMRKIDRVKSRFVVDGFEVALNGRQGERVYKQKVDGEVEAHLIALSCSDPPAGFKRWSLRLLADKAVELHYIGSISHETIRRVLKKTNLSPGSAKAG